MLENGGRYMNGKYHRRKAVLWIYAFDSVEKAQRAKHNDLALDRPAGNNAQVMKMGGGGRH